MSEKRARIIKVFIGRFQPFHNGHLRVLRAACATADQVIVVIGSADKGVGTEAGGSLKNPWSWVTRRHMIISSLTPAELEVTQVMSQEDMPGQDKDWVDSVKKKVKEYVDLKFPGEPHSYTLIGCHKGADTYYLKLYKGWKLELVPQAEALNATDIRNSYFGYTSWQPDLPPASQAFLYAFMEYEWDEYNRLVKENEDARHEAAVKKIGKKING